MSPCFSGCSRPEHSTVRCPGVSRHEQAHRLMASMGSFRLDDPSLWTDHCLHRLLLWPSCLREAARYANGDIAPFCRTFLSSVVFQGLVARVTRIRRSSRPSLPVLVFVRLRSTLSRIFPGDDFRRLLHHSIYCRWQFWTSFLISFRFPVASRSLSSYSRQSAEPF